MSDGPESADEMTGTLQEHCPTGQCRSHTGNGAIYVCDVCVNPPVVADAPRPRGKMKAGKPWREEVREMIAEALRDADVAAKDAMSDHMYFYHPTNQDPPKRSWWERLFG